MESIKRLLKNDELFLIALIVLVAVTSFELGRTSVQESSENETSPIIIDSAAADGQFVVDEEVVEEKAPEVAGATSGAYVGSKNSDKYHLPWCPGAQRIKEENKVWFVSKEEAEAQGYAPAGNCKGI